MAVEFQRVGSQQNCGADGGGSALISMMDASGKGRARRGAQAERAAPDLAEADLMLAGRRSG